MHLLLLFSLLAFAIPVATQEPHANGISPFLGTWKLNVSESKLRTPPQPARLAVTFEALGSDSRHYSCCRASIGSMRDARRAGTSVARAATAIRTRDTTATAGR